MGKMDCKNLTDDELLSLIKIDGKEVLFHELYKRYYSKVMDKCYSLLKNKVLAKESAQDILSKAYEKMDGFKGRSSFSSWLYSITYNYCIDYLRNNKKLHYPDWNNSNELPEIIDETDEDLNVIRYDRLVEIMEKIHPEEKAMLEMKYNDNFSMKQIAETMRITESAAKMRIKRAKARLLFQYRLLYTDAEE